MKGELEKGPVSNFGSKAAASLMPYYQYSPKNKDEEQDN
jgi:hypothetical protein